jgi:hypothetical protein
MSASNIWIDESPTIFVSSNGESTEKFFANFLRKNKHFVLRATGGCGNMKPEFYHGLAKLQEALGGDPNDSASPKFSGFCLFGGTRMIMRDDPTVIQPGITEVYPALRERCPNARILGIIVKAGHLRHTPHGIIVANSPEDPYVTIIHPEQHSVLLLQPGTDQTASWDDEWKRCLKICESHAANHWDGLLSVYNGGGVTERELLTWAELGMRNPFYRVLLVRGSGGTADKYALNEAFLAAHPNVHICNNDVASMRAKFLELGAID